MTAKRKRIETIQSKLYELQHELSEITTNHNEQIINRRGAFTILLESKIRSERFVEMARTSIGEELS